MPGPGFIPAVNDAKVTYSGIFRSQQYVGDLWFYHTAGPIVAADLATLLNAVGSSFLPALAAEQSNDITYTFVRARDYSIVNGATQEQGLSLVGGGTDAMPNNVCISCSFRSGIAGRSFRGRNFVGAIPRDQVAENSVLSTFLSPVLAAFTLMTSPTFATNWQWSIASFRSLGTWRGVAALTPVLYPIFVDNIVDDMDKRLPGRGK